MLPVLALRGSIGPNFWHRLLVVYTFWQWVDCSVPGVPSSCRCSSSAALLRVHQQTMHAAFQYVNRHLLTSDLHCNISATGTCFPGADEIPYYGIDLSLAKLALARRHGYNLLDPEDKAYSSLQCPTGTPNSAEELARFRNTERTESSTRLPTYGHFRA